VARYLESLCKVCRRDGIKLFLKGERCYTPKCAIEKRNIPPGQHGAARKSKVSNFGLRLREKQKLRSMYGLLEKQFKGYFSKASRQQGVTGEELIKILESRLDHVVSRMGFCANHNMSRQYINHGHFLVNQKSVNIPSCILKEGDVISVKEKSRGIPQIKESMEQAKKRGISSWYQVDWDQYSGVFRRIPSREDVVLPVQEQLVVELYSK